MLKRLFPKKKKRASAYYKRIRAYPMAVPGTVSSVDSFLTPKDVTLNPGNTSVLSLNSRRTENSHGKREARETRETRAEFKAENKREKEAKLEGKTATALEAKAEGKVEAKAEAIAELPVIGILGAKGGVGSTTLAANIAAALAAGGAKTTVIDANFLLPDVAHLVGKEPEHSLMELLPRLSELDKQLFDACCVEVANLGQAMTLLSPPLDGDAALKLNLSQLAQCLDLVHSYSDLWVIDLPKNLDKHLVTLADKCQKILLVFEATVSGVAACRRWLNIFRELGYDKDKVICVLNRAGSKYTGVEKQLDDCFINETIERVPNAFAIAWECSTRGVPITLAYPNIAYSRAITKLAQEISKQIKRGNSRV